MRALLLALALLAALKIWVHDSVYRTATEQALIQAYGERAVAACLKEVGGSGEAALGLAVDWSRETVRRVDVGNPALPVRLWDVDNALWNDRFRKAYLVLEAEGANLVCAYDMMSGAVSLRRG